MNRPAISLVIPTRNRPQLVRQTVDALLRQSFKDLEVIVVDNSDDNATSECLTRIGDPRLRLHRTGGLSMPDNWETALRQGSGSLIMLVNDKTQFHAGAIGHLMQCFERGSEPFLTFVIGKSRGRNTWTKETTRVANKTVVGHALEARIDVFQRFAPKGTNCLIQRDYLQKVRSRFGLLCRPISPDYPLATFLLENAEYSLHLSCTLAGIIPNSPSNTHLIQDQPGATGGYFNTLGISENEFFTHVPLNTFLVNNILLNDILKTLEITRGEREPIDQLEYYLMLLSDLVILRREGRPWVRQARQVREALAGKSKAFQGRFLRHVLARFVEGWPNRNRKMRHNFADLVAALRILLGPCYDPEIARAS